MPTGPVTVPGERKEEFECANTANLAKALTHTDESDLANKSQKPVVLAVVGGEVDFLTCDDHFMIFHSGLLSQSS